MIVIWPSAKKQHNVSQKGPFLKISGPPRSLPRDKILGASQFPCEQVKQQIVHRWINIIHS